MRAVYLTAIVVVLTVMSAFGQQSAITAAQAESLVRVVLRHEKIRLSPRYCELEQMRADGTAFVPNYYSFSAYCDYPNTAATTQLGIYVVSPRTGEVWEFSGCKLFKFPELLQLRRKLVPQTRVTEEAEAEYRTSIGCEQ
jgi:hypothetical protein